MIRQWVKDVSSLNRKPQEPILSWLTKPYILSDALKRRYGAMTLRVLNQNFQRPHADEAIALSLDSQERAFVREIVLESNAIARTQGRVVIPQKTYENLKVDLMALGEKPIGETLLYHNPKVQREAFEFAYIEEKHCFARRSVFILKEGSLLVTDFFLTTLDNYDITC
jgi:chorismate--pyruvate lyase